MTKTWKLRLCDYQEVVQTEDFIPWTLFEKKYVQRGETCYRMSFSFQKKILQKSLLKFLIGHRG